ncbi:MAG TPA: sigma-54 dependent transcriptional regulator, partial [Planctomycetota bacterium]|nr:sigma-54 dependent transcriptional regulator [Planctomycetota bacterium]
MSDGILLVDDQPEVLDHLKKVLVSRDYNVYTASDGETAMRRVTESGESISLVILDLDLGGGSDQGLTVLETMKHAHPDLPVMILTGKGTTRNAVRAMKLGAVDFLEKDLYVTEHLEVRLDRVQQFLHLVAENRRLRREGERMKRTAGYYHDLIRDRYQLIGGSQPMVELRNKITALASIPRPVLIRGERGTGKELVAAQIHYRGSRAPAPFIVVNCAAVHPELLESELFGHEKGAFTGADQRRVGRFELADSGTLFLDEIGNMSAGFQEKILRVIEYQQFERVRGSETITVDVRVVAATNADLEERMKQGRFREDLYDRLAFQTIHTPALRQHVEDVSGLCTHFLERFRREVPSVSAGGFSTGAVARLETYPWPGNVRELKNVVERAAIIADDDVIDVRHLELRTPASGDGKSFSEQIQELERSLILDALEQTDYSQTRAAKLLGMSYDQFRHYYRKYRSD